MKRFMLLIAGVMLAATLAACTPTSEKNAETRKAPEGAAQETVDGVADKMNNTEEIPSVTVCIYSIKEDQSGLQQNMDAIEEVTELDAQMLIDKMAELGVIESGIKVNKFEQKNHVLTLDLSSLENAENKQLQTAIANTFLQNYEEDETGELALSVAGKTVSEAGLTFNKGYKTFK